jgi:hypothetical protein
MSTVKTEVMAFKGSQHVRAKTTTAKSLTEQPKEFNYLGCSVI